MFKRVFLHVQMKVEMLSSNGSSYVGLIDVIEIIKQTKKNLLITKKLNILGCSWIKNRSYILLLSMPLNAKKANEHSAFAQRG